MSKRYDNMARQADLERRIDAASPWARLLYSPPRGVAAMEDYLPKQEIAESYGTQWYRFRLGESEYAIRPARVADNPANALWPEGVEPAGELEFLTQAHIIGYCHPGGVPSRSEDRPALRQRAIALVREAGFEPIDIVAISRDSNWLEPMLLIPGISKEAALRIGAELGQLLIVSLLNGRHSVAEVSGASRRSGYEIRVVKLDKAPCPMSLGCDTSHSPKREGGPWVSRSMEVAALWQLHFADAHGLLPCHPCKSRPGEKGRAILLGKWIPASRWKYIHKAEQDSTGDRDVIRTLGQTTPSPRRSVGGGS